MHTSNSTLRLSPWVLAVPLGAALLNAAFFPHYTGDDAFIHFTYVRNLLERGIMAYNGPSPSYGSSSILWVFLGALASWPTGAIPETLRCLDAGLYAISVVLAVAAVHGKYPLSVGGQLLTALFLTANAVAFRWMATGMETGLVCLVSVLILRFVSSRRPFSSALLCMMALLTRPEFLLLPVCCVAAWSFGRCWDRRLAVKFVISCGGLFGLWFVLAGFYFGRIMPMTAIKSFGVIDIPSTVRILQVVSGTFPSVLTIAFFFGLERHFRGVREATSSGSERAYLVFGTTLLLFYLLTGTNLISRYLIVLYFPLAMFCARAMSRHWMTPDRVRWPAGVVIVLALCVEGGAFLTLHAPHMKSFSEGFQQTYAGIGKRIERTAPSDTGAVMVADVGLVGFYSRRPVIDLAGLTSSHVYAAGTRSDSVLIARYRPRFVILRDPGTGIPAYHAMLSRVASHPGGVQILLRRSMPSLGVMADPAQWWQVVVFEVNYEAG